MNPFSIKMILALYQVVRRRPQLLTRIFSNMTGGAKELWKSFHCEKTAMLCYTFA
jgi:hypothetical protein